MSSIMMRKPVQAMLRTTLAAAVALCLVSQPFAQVDGSIAKLRDVSGNVLVGKATGLASGDEALRLTPGTRVITTANSEVIVEYDNGCKVRMKENQRFEVEEGKPCALLVAQPHTILLTPAGAATSIAVLLLPAVFGLGGVGVLIDSRDKQTVSPS